jgi:hypothetical protein
MNADKLIIDVHQEFLKRARQVLLKVREGNVQWLQSFVISMVVRDLWTRNHGLLAPQDAIARTKEELTKLCEVAGLELGDLENFMAKVSRSGVL